MMMIGKRCQADLQRSRPAPADRFIGSACLLLAVLLCLASCRKGEKPAAEQPGQAATPAAAPTVAETVAPGPTIRQTAEPNRPAYSGLKSPRGMAMDDKGRLLLVDMRNAAIRIFDSSGGFLGGWGGHGSGHYGLKDPHGIAVRGEDVYVADTFGAGVELFTINGEWKAKAEAGLYAPSGVAAAPDGKVWIADTGNNRLVVCDRDLSNPRTVGKTGSGPEEFSGPLGIAVAPSGKVFVSDTGNHRIQVLDSTGAFKAHWKFNGFPSDTDSYIDVDSDESLFVSDSVPGAVVHLDRSGKETRRWTTDDAGTKLARPSGIALDKKNRILYVVNSDKDSVVKLKLSGK